MSSSHSSPFRSLQEHSSELEEIIVLSDSTPYEAPPEPLEQEGVQEQIVQLVNPRYLDDNQEEQKKKQEKIQKAIEMMETIKEKEREEANLRKQMMAKKTSKEEMRKLEQQIKKQFPAYQHLSFTALTRVKNKMMSFTRVCKMEQTHKDLKIFRNTRQEQRHKLTQALMLSIQQLRQKIKTEEYCESQNELIEEQTNTLLYCYQIATKIEVTFFKHLHVDKKFGELGKYKNQISIVLRQFKDKNNIKFRRQILRNKINLQDLARAKEEDLKCEKTKEEELAQLQSYIRQNEKDPSQQRQYEEELDLEKINYMNSRKDREQMQPENPKEELFSEGQKPRDNQDLIMKCRERYERCLLKLEELNIERKDRTAQLFREHEDSHFFMQICLKYKLG